MTHVARQVVQPRQASLIPESVHRLRSASGLNPRRAHGVRRLKTTTSRVFCRHRQVQPELLFQVSVAPAWKQCSPETVNPFAKGVHAIFLRHASPCSTVWMTPDISRMSAFGPALLGTLMKYHRPY